ncbi:hypothetical protein KL86DYS1_10187 [uncultured Dysgonomonas sp.]|uniref:Uncharacterized protein n=1 Tax=uncultured Dysgonomonas sp. TaxID=206096 RepID=A0A212IUI9_9BACT|nr:hypothetical protein KL86DYS1_10187 [uncultured Dysgonomonas sp.]
MKNSTYSLLFKRLTTKDNFVKYELADKLKHVFVFSSFNPTGTPSMKLTAQADALTEQSP